MKKTRRPIAALLALALAGIPASGDTKIVMEEGTGIAGDGAEMPEEMRQAFANQEPTTAVYWFGTDRAARVGGGGGMISRLDRGESYFVSDQTKSYTVIELGGSEDSSAAGGTAELVKTDETRKIGSWNTVRYDMTLEIAGDEPTEITLWVSDEVDVDLSAYHAIIEASAAQTGFDWMLRFLEVDGFPVRQEFRMGPIESWQQVVSISEESAPNGTYEPPTGFTKSD